MRTIHMSDVHREIVRHCKRLPTGTTCVSYSPQCATQSLYCGSEQCRVKVTVSWGEMDVMPTEASFYVVDLYHCVRYVDPSRGFRILLRVGQCQRCGHAYYAMARERFKP